MAFFLGQKLLNFVLPPVCPFCRTLVSENKTACGPCWSQIQFISAPYCPQCAKPFEFGSAVNDLKCAKCLSNPPAFKATRAVFRYDDFSRKLILSFKHHNAIHMGPLLAQWMYTHSEDILRNVDFLIPIPLHWTRLLKRGYNQAAILSKEISKLSNVPTKLKVLERVRRTPTQGSLTPKQRQDNVRGAFHVPASAIPIIQGKTLVLIDDVITTGATLDACAKTLIKAGVKEVRVISAARVV